MWECHDEHEVFELNSHGKDKKIAAEEYIGSV